MNQALVLVICLTFVLAVGACGKRASHVDAPDDVEEDRFPIIYPNSSSDPSIAPVTNTPAISTTAPKP